ncbi:MAG: hypothetical protein QG587_1286 [Chloroflexota bacterium]|nr:hypothetical protein [Chloroflexota bacterium]
MAGRRVGIVAALVAAAVTAVGLAACQSLVDQGVGLVDGSRPLPTQPSPPPGAVVACMEALASGVLVGDQADPSLVWLKSGSERTDLTWPYGFRVRFTPDAEVLAPGGRTVAREGEEVSFGGGTITDTFEICTIEGEDFLNPAP